MKKILNLYKNVGETPLEVVERFKNKDKSSSMERMGYAGRLDPMAEGVLLVLVGDENKKIDDYMGLDKEYEAEILLGFSSDSNDVLGIASKGRLVDFSESDLRKRIKEFEGDYEQKIPKYSSYRVDGKPMFHYARKGIKIDDVRKNVFIKSVKVNSFDRISNKQLLRYVVSKIKKVKGDFRQERIVGNWKKLLDKNERYYVVNVTLKVSSGTYIRAIADDFGSDFGGGLLLSLKRTKVGRFRVEDSLKV